MIISCFNSYYSIYCPLFSDDGISNAQFNFTRSNTHQVAVVIPHTNLQFTKIEGGNPLRKSPSHPTMAFNFPNADQPLRSKSPRAAPRQTKDSQLPSNGLYENIDKLSAPFSRCSADHNGGIPPSRCSGYSSSGSRGSSESDLTHHQLEVINSVDMIPDDLTTLSVPGLCDCLHLFELPNAAHKFRQHQIDGQLFMRMTRQMFLDDSFQFSDFELLKLKQLREGWRPRL